MSLYFAQGIQPEAFGEYLLKGFVSAQLLADDFIFQNITNGAVRAPGAGMVLFPDAPGNYLVALPMATGAEAGMGASGGGGAPP